MNKVLNELSKWWRTVSSEPINAPTSASSAFTQLRQVDRVLPLASPCHQPARHAIAREVVRLAHRASAEHVRSARNSEFVCLVLLRSQSAHDEVRGFKGHEREAIDTFDFLTVICDEAAAQSEGF